MNNTEIIFKDDQGNIIKREDLLNSTGIVNYEIIGTENISQKAKGLHQMARVYGQSGNYDKTIELLEDAHRAAPTWPYPLYDLAFTYLLKEDFENALFNYEKVDRLAPKGFFTSKVALYTLEKEKNGEFPEGLYLAYLQLEWINNLEDKRERVKSLIAHVPNYPPAWKELSSLLDDTLERKKAIENGLKHNPDPETKGILLINKALICNMENNNQEAIKILGELIFDSNSTLATVELAKFSLHSITKQNQE
ncbi:MAG: tetratricopeptide repeat protein [Candidatus Hermodarchaeota archaeon]